MQSDTSEFSIEKIDYSIPYNINFRETLRSLKELLPLQIPFVIIGKVNDQKNEEENSLDHHKEGVNRSYEYE